MKPRLPRALIVVVLAAVMLAILHALGVRRATSVLAGIAADPIDAALALVYIGCWFFTILVGPIVVSSAALLRLGACRVVGHTPGLSHLDESLPLRAPKRRSQPLAPHPTGGGGGGGWS